MRKSLICNIFSDSLHFCHSKCKCRNLATVNSEPRTLNRQTNNMKARILIIFLILLLSGCAEFIPFREEPFHNIIVLPETIIYIKNDCDGSPGWTKCNRNEICVWGYKQKGLIVPDYSVLGHEIGHKLNHIDPEIRNPDWPNIKN